MDPFDFWILWVTSCRPYHPYRPCMSFSSTLCAFTAFWLISNDIAGDDQHACNGCSVFQRSFGHPSWVNDTHLYHIAIFVICSIVSIVTAFRSDFTTTTDASPLRSQQFVLMDQWCLTTTLIPIFSTSQPPFSELSFSTARISATPPPGTIPCSTAALTVQRLQLCFFLFISISVAAQL